MNRRTFAALSLLTLAAPLVASPSSAQPKPAAATTLSAGEIMERVDLFYGKVSTYKATFKQQFKIQAYQKEVNSTGSVVFEKPGKMSWRYTNNGNRVVSDGQVVKVYERDNNQMLEQQLNQTSYPAALSFLTGQGKLKQSFTFSKFPSSYPGHVLLGLPLQPTPTYKEVYFYVDATTFHVRRVLIVDAQGNRNRFDFEQAKVNTKPPKGEFAFTPPPGTQIIKK